MMTAKNDRMVATAVRTGRGFDIVRDLNPALDRPV
jgi:hypothetical protein